MAKCNLCDKWLLLSSKFGLCDDCKNFIILDLKNRLRIINDSERIIKTSNNPKTKLSRWDGNWGQSSQLHISTF